MFDLKHHKLLCKLPDKVIQNTEYRMFIVNQIEPLYYNMLLFTISVRRQIYFTNLYSRVTGTLCVYSRTTGILCALAWDV